MRRKRLQRLRMGLLLGFGLGLTLLMVAAYETGTAGRLELDSVDKRFSIRNPHTPPREVAVVAVDDVSFSELATRWPFPRGYHARVIDQLRKAGAKVIAYDVQFTEPSDDPNQDLKLYRAAGRSGNVVFATTEVDDNGHTNVLGGDGNLRQISARAANSVLPNDPGGVIRKIQPSVEGLASFPYVAAQAAGKPIIDPSSESKRWIDFAGSPGTIETVSFSRVYNGRFDPSNFKDKVVVVGPAAPSLQDVHPTSIGGDSLMSGAEIQANAIATVLHGEPLTSTPGWINVGLIILLSMLVPIISLWLRPLRALAIAAAAGVVYLVIAQLAFNNGHVLPIVYPLAGLVTTSIAALGIHYLTETRERRRLKSLFGRFVGDTVVDKVVDRAEDELRLVGEELEATVLFTDLRGFTSFSESLPPPRVFEILSDYHEELCGAVLDNGGTLVSYLGDGLMAVFGAPIEQDDHADRAVKAAQEMIGPRLAAFNGRLKEQSLPQFRLGVGLNTGPLMSGNVGSDRRLEYSTIGDTVNTAARIEQLTKNYEHMLLMSDATRAAMKDSSKYNLLRVGESPIRGREQTIELWTIAPSRFERKVDVAVMEHA